MKLLFVLSSLTGSSFTGIFHPRYQYSTGQPTNVATSTGTATASAYIAGTLKSNAVASTPPSTCSQPRTTVFARPVAGTSSDACLQSAVPTGLPTLNATTETGLSVIRRSSMVSHPLLKSSSRLLANGPCLEPELNPYHPNSMIDQNSGSVSTSDAIDLESCIQASSLVHGPSGSVYGSSSGRIGADTNGGSAGGSLSYSANQAQRAPLLTAAATSLVPTETTNSLLCRNRFFVIRPGAVRQGSTGLVVRARRPDGGAAMYSSMEDNSSPMHSTPQSQLHQQSQPQPPSESS
ncbi:unnamed protein product [Echinostoma caproni]|uniref:Secreted protein n=1 Tax=Echinostoma caproni TaxID=27848 RepID=A0A183AXV4_9TREM|nr:unnamed protein product [Echinostoma caproni]